MWGAILTVVLVAVLAAAVGLGDYFKQQHHRLLEETANNEMRNLEMRITQAHGEDSVPIRCNTFLDLTPPPYIPKTRKQTG